MSRRLPVLSGAELIDTLKRSGFDVTRIRGSHYFLRHRDHPARSVVVPVHGRKPLKKGTLASILKQAGLSPDALERE
jgi:predicted RNA binding protein YcfA (HicA-like mRNA interferase family)